MESVERHYGAKTYHARSENAVASVQLCAIIGVSWAATSSPVADTAYTVPKAPTATSRAASPGISAIEICQLKPIGARTISSVRPSMPAKLYWIAGPDAFAGGAGNDDKNHRTMVRERMMVPTRVRKIFARSRRPMNRFFRCGHRYEGSSIIKGCIILRPAATFMVHATAMALAIPAR